MLSRKSQCLVRRSLFCSDATDGSEKVVKFEVKESESGAQSKGSSAVPPTFPKTGANLTVGWLVAFKFLFFLFDFAW